MSRIEIKPLTPNEAAAVIALAREIWQMHYPGIISQAQINYMLDLRYQPAVLMQELEQAGLWWDQAFLDGERVGLASCLWRPATHEIKLDKLYVHPRAQAQGVGRALIDAVLAHGRSQGARTLILAVNKNNRAAIAAYERSGFSIREAVCADIGGGFVMDDFIMTRSLSPGESPA